MQAALIDSSTNALADSPEASPLEASGQRGKAIGFALATVTALGLAIVFREPIADATGGLLQYVRDLGFWGPALLAAVYVIATVLMAPGLLLTLGAGWAFGLVTGTLTVMVGSVVGATIAFLVGRYAARDFVGKLASDHPRFAAIDRAVAKSGWKIVLLTRLSPAFPFNVINYLFGATQVGLREYVLASWIGMIPGTILYVYLGAIAGNLTDLLAGKVEGGAAGQALLVVGLLATAAVTVVVTRIAGRALAEEADADPLTGWRSV